MSDLPDGFVLRLDPRRTTADAGRLLVGGAPLTALRLPAGTAARLVGDDLVVTDEISRQLARRLLSTNLAAPDPNLLGPAEATDLTVVVPVRDRTEQLARCLAGLRGLQTIVVDDGSHDPTAVAGVAGRFGARVVALPVNVGPAAARNAGLAQVRTPYVAFVDSDVEVGPDALLRLAGHFADPRVVLVGPRVEGCVRSPHPRWFEQYDATVSSLTLGRRPASVRPGAAVAWLPSACLVARRAVLGEGFSESMRVGEDVDLVWRLVAAGHTVRYEPTVTVHHDVRATMRGWLGRKVLYGSSGAELARRHGTHVAPAVLTPPMALAGAALLLRRWWAPPVATAVVAHAAHRVHRSLPAGVAPRERAVLATRIATRGAGWAVRQESALMLRHWWPPTLVACLLSSRARRMLTTALVVDGAVGLSQELRDATPGPVILLAGRRLEDLAYGLGLWWGALRARSTAALRPRRPG